MVKAFTFIEVVVTVCIIGLLCICGCYVFQASHVTEGTVTYRKFIPEHEESDTTYISVGENAPSIPITHYHTVPDKYVICIEGAYNDKTYTRTLYVDKTSYQMLRVGDHLRVEDLPLTPTAEAQE